MIDHITFRVITHETEDKSKVNLALDFFLSYCMKDNPEKLLNITDAKGYYGNQIIVTECTISKKNECLKLIELCNTKMTDEDKSIILSEIDKRLDENLNFYLRFDKQEAYLNKLKITKSNDSIVMKIKIKTYPKSIEKAHSIVEELFV